jgi:hypothetical protein
MSMARRGSYRKVYAPRGDDAEIEEHAPLVVVEAPPKNVDVPSKPVKLCPHGGEYFNDIPRCGLCFKQPNSGLTADQSFAAFLSSMYDVCKRTAWRENHRNFKAISWEDKVHHAFAVLSEPKNMLKIMNAQNPLGLAYSMANFRLIDLERKKVYWKEWSASSLKFPSEDGEGESLGSNTARLEKIDALTDVQRALQDALDKSECVRVFPGATLLWTRENIFRLINLAKEAMSKLPKEPFNHSMLISLRSNAYGSGRWGRNRTWSWPELAKWARDSQGRNVTEKMVRYAFERSTAEVRLHIMKFLTPDLGEVNDRKRR